LGAVKYDTIYLPLTVVLGNSKAERHRKEDLGA